MIKERTMDLSSVRWLLKLTIVSGKAVAAPKADSIFIGDVPQMMIDLWVTGKTRSRACRDKFFEEP